MVSITIHAIKQLKSIDGVNMSELDTFLDRIQESGIDIKKKENLGDVYFNNFIKDPYLDALINKIETRFDDKSVLASFDI